MKFLCALAQKFIPVAIYAASFAGHAATLPELLPGEWKPQPQVVNGETVEVDQTHTISASEWVISYGNGTQRRFKFALHGYDEQTGVIYLKADPETEFSSKGTRWRNTFMTLRFSPDRKTLLRYELTGMPNSPQNLSAEFKLACAAENVPEAAKIAIPANAIAERKKQEAPANAAKWYADALIRYVESAVNYYPNKKTETNDLMKWGMDRAKEDMRAALKLHPVLNADIQPVARQQFEKKLTEMRDAPEDQEYRKKFKALFESTVKDPVGLLKTP